MDARGFSRQIREIGDKNSWFEISDEDTASDPSYFGYVNKRGFWIIQQRTASTGAYRYIAGKSAYTTNWTGRAALTYDYYYNIKFLPFGS